MYRQKITTLLSRILSEQGITDITPQVDYPADRTHGDYASNVSMMLSKKLGKSPRDIAEEIVTKWQELGDEIAFIEKIDVAGPGFINFTLSQNALLDALQKADQDKMTASSSVSQFAGKKVMVEYTDPNPFKELHIGHLYSNIVGESIARMLQKNGAIVKRVCYQGDVGLHVAKSLWGMKELLRRENKTITEYEESISNVVNPQPPVLDTLSQKAKFLGEAYAVGSTAFEDDESVKQAIIEINKQVYAKDLAIWELYEKGRAWSLEYFDSIYKILGTQFDYKYFESEVGEKGLAIVTEYLQKGIFEESQGAVIFPGEKYGLHSRVFINSLGLPTYEAKELGLAPRKYEDFTYELSIVITGNEVNEYFKVLLKALEQVEPELAAKTKHLSHGMVRLPEGKMSSRKGNVITGMSLINEATARIGIERYGLKIEDYRTDPQWKTAFIIGIGAVKYALLKSGVGKDVEFSFSESISFEGNSGPYLQYTYARTQSLLKKASSEQKERGDVPELNDEEKMLLRHLVTFDEIVIMAAESYSPNTVSTYLYELAQKFNNFYQKHQILPPVILRNEEPANLDNENNEGRSFANAHGHRLPLGDDKRSKFRLALTKKVGETIKEGLYLLGIEAPEKM